MMGTICPAFGGHVAAIVTDEWCDAQTKRLNEYNAALMLISRKAKEVFGPDIHVTIRDGDDGLPVLMGVKCP